MRSRCKVDVNIDVVDVNINSHWQNDAVASALEGSADSDGVTERARLSTDWVWRKNSWAKRSREATLDVFLKKYWRLYVIYYIEGTTLLLILFS